MNLIDLIFGLVEAEFLYFALFSVKWIFIQILTFWLYLTVSGGNRFE